MIDDIRLSAENKMLADMKKLFEDGASLEFIGSNGETPVKMQRPPPCSNDYMNTLIIDLLYL